MVMYAAFAEFSMTCRRSTPNNPTGSIDDYRHAPNQHHTVSRLQSLGLGPRSTSTRNDLAAAHEASINTVAQSVPAHLVISGSMLVMPAGPSPPNPKEMTSTLAYLEPHDATKRGWQNHVHASEAGTIVGHGFSTHFNQCP